MILFQDVEASTLSDNDDNSSTESVDEAVEQSRVDEIEISPLKVAAGISLVIFAGFSFTASNIIQKFYVPTLTFWQLLLHRAIVQVIQKLIYLFLLLEKTTNYRKLKLKREGFSDIS